MGIMFSLIEYQSGNFWNNVLVHAVWNMSTMGICHVGFTADKNSLFTLIITTKSAIISGGGDFGAESSIISIAGYVVVIVIAWLLIRRSRVSKLNQS